MDAIVLASPDYLILSKPANNQLKMAEQFNKIKERFLKYSIQAHIIHASIADPSAKYPNLVFVSNSALILRGWPTKVAILSRYSDPERRGEEARVGAFLKYILGYKVISLPEEDGLYFEGQGDSRWSHDTNHLWISYGVGNTSLAGIDAVKKLILEESELIHRVPPKIHILQMIEKKINHLDLSFLPLPNGRVLVQDASFSNASRKEINNIFGKDQVISIPPKYIFACNSVCIDSNCLLIPKIAGGCRQWMHNATKMHIEEINVSEFHLSGRSISSMILPLWKQF
jgi:N-dimethylarginine dimethylaminohydrolase